MYTVASEQKRFLDIRCFINKNYYYYLCFAAVNITVDTGGVVDAEGLGYGPGVGPGAGLQDPTTDPYKLAGSGGSHGGLGGRGSVLSPAGSAYDNVLYPTEYGSGGNTNGHYSSAQNTEVCEHVIDSVVITYYAIMLRIPLVNYDNLINCFSQKLPGLYNKFVMYYICMNRRSSDII